MSELREFERYVAIGDSSTEGLDDPDGRGGYHGWANRLAETIAREQGQLLYANLGIRGRRTHQILERQLPPALAMKPDLVTLFAGTNDVVSGRFDVLAVERDLELMQRALIDQGATLLTFTLPDLSRVLPTARSLLPKVAAFNEACRSVAARTGALLVDFETSPVAADPRLWSDDRFHANSLGHTRIAAALADRLGISGTDDSWQQDLPPAPSKSWLQQRRHDAHWVLLHLVPWLWRHSRGRSSGDGRLCKRPELQPVTWPSGPSRG